MTAISSGVHISAQLLFNHVARISFAEMDIFLSEALGVKPVDRI